MFVAEGFDAQQVAAFNSLLDLLLEMMIEFIVELTSRLRVVPMQGYAGIIGTLAMMMEEGRYANN